MPAQHATPIRQTPRGRKEKSFSQLLLEIEQEAAKAASRCAAPACQRFPLRHKTLCGGRVRLAHSKAGAAFTELPVSSPLGARGSQT